MFTWTSSEAIVLPVALLVTILIALIIGSISFELFDRFSKLDEIIKILKLFHDFRRGLITLETTKPTEDDSDHEPNNSKDKPK